MDRVNRFPFSNPKLQIKILYKFPPTLLSVKSEYHTIYLQCVSILYLHFQDEDADHQ